MGEGSSNFNGRSLPSEDSGSPTEGRDRGRDQQLLHRHRPYLRYDTQEAHRAVSVATAARYRGNPLAHGDGTPLLSDVLPVQATRTDGDRVYGRVVRDAGRTWLQYWLW